MALSNIYGENISDEFGKIVGSYILDQPFVVEIKNGFILEKTGLTVDDNCTLLLETTSSREDKLNSFLDTSSLCRLLSLQHNDRLHSSVNTTIDTGVPLIRAPFQKPTGRTVIASKGYSHWVQCYLTLLQGLDVYKQQTGITPTLIIEPDPPSWLRESLNHFGYDSDNMYFWNPAERLHISRLVVPSVRRIEKKLNYDEESRGAQYKILSPRACRWVRKKALERYPKKDGDITYSPKVFISRGDASRRRLQNRNEIMSLLKDRGFESYELSKMSFAQQVKLFSQAEKIVGVHGAGFANLIFSSDCTVTEIFGERAKPTYYLLSEVLDLNYQAISGDSVTNHNKSILHRDITIQKRDLESII